MSGTIRECQHKQARHQHGDYAMYRLDGCRCYPCAATRSRYDEARTKAMTAGTWQPFVAIGPVQDHIAALKELGLGDRSIAQLANLDRKQVRDISSGYRRDPGRGNPAMTKVRTETAARLFAVPLDERALPDGMRIDAARTWGQVEELLAAGWTKSRIATEGLGTKCPALQLNRTWVSVRNARAIDALYRRVIDSSGYQVADDQDDQTGDEPAVELDWVMVERVLAGEPVRMTTAERKAMVAALHHDHGLNRGVIAARLSMSSTRVNEILAGSARAEGAA